MNSMIIEKAIKHFTSLQKRYTTQHNGKHCEYVKLALDAISKRVAQNPILIDGRMRCPSCRGNVNSLNYYCDACGQAIKWNDKEFVEYPKKATQYDLLKNLTIEEMAKTRISKHIADNEGGYTYFCGDFDRHSGNLYNNLFQSETAAYQNALKAEIEWLKSEALFDETS